MRAFVPGYSGKERAGSLAFLGGLLKNCSCLVFFKGPPMKVQMNKGPASGALHGWMALKIDI